MSDSNGKTHNKTYALEYAEIGFQIFPAHYILDGGRCSCGKADCESPEKYPLTHDGLFSATIDPEKISQWWTVNPLSNIAIRAGAEPGFWPLDLDGIEGVRDFNQLAEQHPNLPEIPESDTGGSGRHLFFHYPDSGIHNATKLAGKNIENARSRKATPAVRGCSAIRRADRFAKVTSYAERGSRCELRLGFHPSDSTICGTRRQRSCWPRMSTRRLCRKGSAIARFR